jgi:cyanophycinase
MHRSPVRFLFLGSIVLILALAAGCLEPAGARTPRGRLFIIGGGERPPEMMRQFIDLAGGPRRARILVIPNASSEPETTGLEQVSQFRALGVASAECLYLRRL